MLTFSMMTRSAKLAVLALTALSAPFVGACGGGAPPLTPSSAAVSAPGIFTTSGATQGLFGARGVDFGECLAGSNSPSCFSARVATRAVGTPPDAPARLTATSVGSSVTLTWSAPVAGDPVSTYIIEAGSASGTANLANLVTNSAATSFSASGVGAGTYFVRVRAQNGGGVSAPSNEVVLNVGSAPCAGPPNPPGALTAIANGTSVTLTWTAPVGGCTPTSYTVEAGSAPGLANLATVNTGSLSTTFSAIDVAAGTYYVRVRARNGSGPGGPSNEAVLTVGAPGPGNFPSACIDFETVPGAIPREGLAISNQYASTYGITFSLETSGFPRLAEVGSPVAAFGSSFGDDTPAPNQGIGRFFLTDDGLLQGLNSQPLIVRFQPPTASVSAVLLDIDFDEMWTIQARDAVGSVLQTVVIRAGDPGTGDGKATRWSIVRGAADIHSIRFVGRRTAAGSFGLGFDNFCARSGS